MTLRIFFFIFLSIGLFSKTISTFYGNLEVTEPILLELIDSPAFQRLKHIHQYGISYYTGTHKEEYNRYDHSLGVFAILRLKGASLKEQIAGLLHDVSHTAFSHVGDFVFKKNQQEEDYQSLIHPIYLASSGIEKILNRHGFTIDQISPKKSEFAMLEQPLPNLCADRIDYNIQGAYFQKFINREEAQKILEDLRFEEGKWLLTNQDLATKLAQFSLFMTENCWGHAINFMTSQWLAEALLHGFQIGLISWHEFHFGTDQEIWDKLIGAKEPFIQQKMQMIKNPDQYCKIVPPSIATQRIAFKCRGIDPWIQDKETIARLSSFDKGFEKSFQKLVLLSKEGWSVQLDFATF